MEEKRSALHENVRHGDLGFPMKVYLNDFTTYVAQKIQWHWHEEIEFVVVTSGVTQFEIGADTFLLKKGEGIFINANILHSMRPYGEEPAYMFSIVANPAVLGIEKGFLLSSKYVMPFITNSNLLYEIIQPDQDWKSAIISRLEQIYTRYEEEAYGYEYTIRNILCEVWFELVNRLWRFKSEISRAKDLDEERIYEAMEYIRKYYHKKLSLEDICKAVNVSKSECCRCFQRKLKMSPFEYLLTHRITIAAKMLETTNKTVVEIALQTGFSSNSYFCKLFKKYMNCTPLVYRETRKKLLEKTLD